MSLGAALCISASPEMVLYEARCDALMELDVDFDAPLPFPATARRISGRTKNMRGLRMRLRGASAREGFAGEGRAEATRVVGRQSRVTERPK